MIFTGSIYESTRTGKSAGGEGEEEEESTIPEENDLKSEKPYDKMIRKSQETWHEIFEELLNE